MHDREVKSLSVASPARLVRSQREQILPLSRLDVKIPDFLEATVPPVSSRRLTRM